MILREDNFKTSVFDCSTLLNGTTDLNAPTKDLDLNDFESRLVEKVSKSPLLKLHRNSSFNIEFFLNIMVFGRDGNELPLPIDESIILTNLAVIDNNAISATANVSVKAPRRFFRIGVAEVKKKYYYKK